MTIKNIKEDVIRVRIDKNLKERVKKICKHRKITMSEWITSMIENEVERYEFKLKSMNYIEKRVVATEKKTI